MLPSTAKNLSDFTSFLANIILRCQKEYLHCIISRHLRAAFLKHFESKYLYIAIYLLKKNLFPRCSNVLSGEGWDRGGGEGGDWINFSRQFTVWALQNVLQFLILIYIFENSTIFSISILLFISLKRWNFPDNFDFKGKIEATFLKRSHFLSI